MTLEHPGLVTIFEPGETSAGDQFMDMELVKGTAGFEAVGLRGPSGWRGV